MRLVVGITGASGSIYAKCLLEKLKNSEIELHLVITNNGQAVFKYELDMDFDEFISDFNNITLYDNDNMFSSIASGSFKTDGMIIIPSTMTTVGKISNAIADTLICRAADVVLKERRKLVVCPRETPLSKIHLKNMLNLADANAIIFPLLPAFYAKSKSIDEVVSISVSRLLDIFDIETDDYFTWK